MSNITLAWPNNADKCALSSPQAFVSTLPLSNLRTPIYQQVARTIGTELTIDATASEYIPMSMIGIASHNLSAAATIRIRVYYDDLKTVLLYDSGELPAWPALHQSTDLEWEENAFWLGTARDEDLALYTPLFAHFMENSFTGRVVSLEISDPDNSNGFIELGRLLICRWWEPELNPQYGDVQLNYEEQTERSTANDGTDFFYKKKKRRLAAVNFTNISEEAAYARLFGMLRTQGVDGEIVFSYDREPNAYYVQRTFVGRLQQLDPLNQQSFGLYQSQINLREVI